MPQTCGQTTAGVLYLLLKEAAQGDEEDCEEVGNEVDQ